MISAVLFCSCIVVPTENTLYLHGFEVALVYSADLPGRGHPCFEGHSNRTWLWAEACSTAEHHWKLGIMFSVKTSCRSHLLLPLYGIFPQNILSISPKGFNAFMSITSTWKEQCTSTGTFAQTELVFLREGGNWAEIDSETLFTFLIGLAYNIEKG